MKSILIICVFLAAGQFAFAQQTEERSVGSFKGIGVAEGVEVYLQKGNKESMRVETSGHLAPADVITTVNGDYLKIHMRDGHHNGSAKVYVTYVNLDNLFASAAGNIYCDGVLEAPSLKLGGSSAAVIELKVKVGHLEVDVSSAANVDLEGTADSAEMETSSAGEIDAYDLEVKEAQIKASSAGSVKLAVVDSIEASASSGGTIRYRGNPSRAITHSSSGGSVRKSG